MKLTNKAYKIAAWVGRLVLPACGTLYGTVGALWHLPYTDEIPKTIMAVALFLNTILEIQSADYFKAMEESGYELKEFEELR